MGPELAVLCTPWKCPSLGCSAAGPAGLGHPRMLWSSLCQGWKCWGPICQGPALGVSRAGIPGDCAAVRGLVHHNALHPPWSSVATPTPHILHLTPCSPHPAAGTRSCWGCPATATGQGNGGGTYLSPHSRQAVLCGTLLPLCLFIDGVTLAAAAIGAPVTSSVGLAMEMGPGWGRDAVLGCTRGPGVPIVWLGSQYWCAVFGAVVLILELESCHCALTTLGTGDAGQQEHGEPKALGTGRTGNQWTLGTQWTWGLWGH